MEIVTVPNFNRSAIISQANAQVTAAVRSYLYERVSASSSQHSASPPVACCVWSQISPPPSADSRRGSNTVGKLASRIPPGLIDICLSATRLPGSDNPLTTKQSLKHLGVIVPLKAVECVPRMMFENGTAFRCNTQFNMESDYIVQSDPFGQQTDLVRILAIKQSSRQLACHQKCDPVNKNGPRNGLGVAGP